MDSVQEWNSVLLAPLPAASAVTLESILIFWCTMAVNIGLGFYKHKRKAIVEKFEVELQWVALLCMHLTLSHVKLTKALRTDACIALLVYFSFHTRLQEACAFGGLWEGGGEIYKDAALSSLLVVSAGLSAVLSSESCEVSVKDIVECISLARFRK